MCAIFIIMETEIWKDVPWYEWFYQVSNLWNIASINYRNWWYRKMLKLTYIFWYYKVTLKKWKQLNTWVHRFVAKAFIPNPENKRTVKSY